MNHRRATVGLTIVGVSAVVLVLAVVFLVNSMAGLGSTVGAALSRGSDGDAEALLRVRATAESLTSSIGYVQTSVDAETRAATTFTGRSGDVSLTPLAWSGAGTTNDPVVVDVRLDAQVAAISSPQIFGRSRPAGSAVECYRFTLPVSSDARSERITCPQDAEPPPAPVATVPPELPADAEERLRAVLATDDVSAAAVRAVFPDPATTVEVTVTDAGETVAAVGVPVSRDCVVLVRRPDGAIDPVSFRRISLEPGEAGCSTTLYTNPPF